MIKRYGFIIKAESYSHVRDSTDLNAPEFSTHVVGVSSDDEAIVVAKAMIESGIQVIELCGGFGADSASYIIESLDTNVPIGYVTFSDQETNKLEQLLK
ncbi:MULTISPECIES: DUF6506 family protein [Vibrio]|uniref:DUF6506 family protein n=1 Tax=Vibrio TaxID=662 RepID=UPI0020765F99|nr:MULTISPECIES: DUF6506 family protein [Vibrio]USD33781.1 hypothetical protein J8Z27_06730 [Vibrio sp. SCSIO 43186]USD46881.1 hypothetical protein J4N38_07115 [Vibrio sp. SCSIO 43145]USD70905.1 hypothetical protein J4N41_06735 [Vibrio sp. SCSIO 43139]USD95813.1 hypothetical protein CTT30_06845 [Vibrio coralliilyticus]